MKKTLLTLLGVLVLGAGFAMAQDDLFYTDNVWTGGVIKSTNALSKLVNWEDVWGFNKYETDLLTCSSTGESVLISAPIVNNDIEDPVYGYEIFLSPYRLNDLRAGNIDIDLSKFYLKELKLDNGASEVQFEIPTEELDPTQIYYGFLVPFESYDLLGNPSSEFCFQIEAGQCTWSAEACDALELVLNPVVNEPEPVVDEPVVDEPVVDEPNPDEQHGAACIGMDSAHVSHTVKGNVITLTWIAVDGDNVEISIWDPEAELYRTLGTVKMSDEKFSYTMQWDGEQNFSLTNGCKEVRYKADAAVKKDEPKPIPATPATGPAENVLYIAIAAIVLYGAYTLLGRKSETK